MRDIMKIFAAGSILTAYALLVPTIVEAVPADAAPRKAFAQRLPQAGGDAPTSAVEVRVEAGRTPVRTLPLLAGPH